MPTYMRFIGDGKECVGRLEGETLHLVEGNFPGDFRETGRTFPKARVERILPPVTPGKLIAIGLNYRDHALEMKHTLPKDPVMFLLAVSSLTGHESRVVYPSVTKELGFEAELAVVIGKGGVDIPEARALEHVFGYTCANDVSARDVQRQDGQWGRSKSYPTFTPLGPVVVTGLDPSDLKVSMKVNGQVRQNSTTAQLIFSVPKLIAFLSSFMTLEAGDVISTGTPGGVGLVNQGDVMEVEVQGVGVLRNTVA